MSRYLNSKAISSASFLLLFCRTKSTGRETDEVITMKPDVCSLVLGMTPYLLLGINQLLVEGGGLT
jgi:hypothetical protein